MTDQHAEDDYGDELDFTQVPEGAGQFPVLPNGRYRAQVSDVSLEEGPTDKYLKWTFVVVDDDAPAQNMKVFHNTSFAPKSLSITYGTLAAILGEELPRKRWESKEAFLAEYYGRFIGREVMVQTRQREWEGTMRNSVVRVTAVHEGGGAQVAQPGRTKKKMF